MSRTRNLGSGLHACSLGGPTTITFALAAESSVAGGDNSLGSLGQLDLGEYVRHVIAD